VEASDGRRIDGVIEWHNGHRAGGTAVNAAKGYAGSDSESIPPDLIQIELERIIASSAFDVSRRNRAFLRFIVEETRAGRGDRIKAYTIGTSVLQRDETFNPQADPIVRIEASRLAEASSAII
jgi:hypothetical protein